MRRNEGENMVELQCSWCGLIVRHREAEKFIEEGWRHYGAVEYCPKHSAELKKINHDKYSMALYLLHKLSKSK